MRFRIDVKVPNPNHILPFTNHSPDRITQQLP